MLHPFAMQSDHPLFWLNVRRLRWWQRGRGAPQYATQIIVWTVMALLLGYVIFIGVRYAIMVQNHTGGNFMPVYNVTEDGWIVLLWSGGISIGLSYLLDFVLMAFTVNSINGERTANRWNLIELTPLSGQSIVEALHSASQLRLWRMTMLVIGSRIAVVLGITLHGLVIVPVLEDNTYYYIFDGIRDFPMQVTFALLVFGLIAGVFVIEPLWRLRATTALAMAVSAQVNRFVTAMALAFPLLVGVWLTMAGVAAGGIWLMTYVVDRIYRWIPGYSNSEELVTFLVILAFFAAEALFIYHGFRLIRAGGLRWTLRRALSLQEEWAIPAVALPWWNTVRWWLPHSGIWRKLPPLLTHHIRYVRWWRGMHSPYLRAGQVMLWVWLALIVLYTLVLGVIASWPDAAWDGRLRMEWLNSGFLMLVYLGGGLAFLVIDIVTARVTRRTLAQMRLGDDLVKMTTLSPRDGVETCRTLARLHSWTANAGLVGFLLGVLGAYFSLHFVDWFMIDNGRTALSWLGEFFQREAKWAFTLVFMVLVVAPAKVRMLTAVLVALTLRFEGVLLAVLRVGVVLLMLLVQGTLLILEAGVSGIWFEWGEILAGAVLALIFLLAVEQGALALARRFWQRAR